MEPDFMSQVLQELGFGSVPPIFNEANKKAHQNLIGKQLDIAKFKALNGKVDDSIARLFGHVTNIQECLTNTKHLNIARREAESSERDLLRVAELGDQRNSRDSRELGKELSKVSTKISNLREDIATRSAINELLEDEYQTDFETCLKWTGEVDDYEEDILTVLKFQLKDEIRIKESHLKLEKLRLKVKHCKSLLDVAATDSRMAQLGLDKTAEEFRVLHHERHVAISKWQEANDLIVKRDEELQVIFNEVNDVKSTIRDNESELQEQLNFLSNEKDNLSELERQLADLERKCRQLGETLEVREKELEVIDSEVTIEKRQIWRIGTEINSKRTKLNGLKKELRKKIARCEQLSMELELARSRKLHTGSLAMTADDRAKEVQQMLDGEESQLNAVQFDLDKLREKKVAKEKVLKDLVNCVEANNLRIQGLALEIKNISKKTLSTRIDLSKKEDIAIANNYKLAQIERELAQIRGTQADINRAKLKENIEQSKLELENRLSDKRNLDHLVHKMASDVRKVRRDIEMINGQQDRIRASLEKVTVINESCERERTKLEESLGVLLMDQKMMKVTEKKAREELEELNADILELKKQDMEVNEQLLEQRADAESKKEVFAAQLRCLKDELSTIRGEIRERKDRVEKLKIRHELAIQALGETKIDEKGAKLTSHARHLVTIAQEKAELMDQSSTLAQKIEKEEKELEGLEQAMSMLKTSNDQYRETNLRNNSKMETDEISFLKDQVYSKDRHIKQIKSRIAELAEALRDSEHLLLRTEKEINSLKQIKEDKMLELQQVEKDLSDQEKKVHRAQKSCANLAKEMREKVTNGDIFEIDMNLRTEKEKQRAALIKLREISSIDPEFSKACQRELESLGLTLPVASRLEVMSTSSQVARSVNTRLTTGSSMASSVRGSFFRQRSQSGSTSAARSSAHTSVLVMELNESLRPAKSGKGQVSQIKA